MRDIRYLEDFLEGRGVIEDFRGKHRGVEEGVS